MEETKQKDSFFVRMATWIVDKRNLFFLIYIAAIIFCLFSRNWVQVENDVTAYLPADTETRQGLTAMNENFLTPGSARVMVSNVTYETAPALYEEIAARFAAAGGEFYDFTAIESEDVEYIDGFHGGDRVYARIALALDEESEILAGEIDRAAIERLLADPDGNPRALPDSRTGR